MCQYTIYVTLEGIVYQTNVIVNKDQSIEKVYDIAREQVMKQWAN